jgi:hypothetical protein
MFLMFFLVYAVRMNFCFFVLFFHHINTFLKTYVFYHAICLSTPHVYCDMVSMLEYLHLSRNIGIFIYDGNILGHAKKYSIYIK